MWVTFQLLIFKTKPCVVWTWGWYFEHEKGLQWQIM